MGSMPSRMRTIGLLAAIAGHHLAAAAEVACAQTWPADAAWRVLECGGAPSFDPRADEPAARDERDVVGDATSPALYFAADASHYFFRMRVDAAPTTGTEFRPFGWGVELDTDGTRTSYELLGQVDGIGEEVVLGENSVQSMTNDPADPIEATLTTYAVATHARGVLAEDAFASSFGGDEDWFVDWALDRTDLAAQGITDATALVLVMGTSSNAQAINADLACHVGGSGARTLTGVSSDPFRPDGTPIADADGDGLTDPEEVTLGTDPSVADSDGDGFADGVEVRAGTDPRDPSSRPSAVDGGPGAGGPVVGIRGGPGGCAAGGVPSSGAAYVIAVVVLGLATRRRALRG